MLFCGMGLGQMNETKPVNRLRTKRTAFEEFVCSRYPSELVPCGFLLCGDHPGLEVIVSGFHSGVALGFQRKNFSRASS